jgi:hypothetical protein
MTKKRHLYKTSSTEQIILSRPKSYTAIHSQERSKEISVHAGCKNGVKSRIKGYVNLLTNFDGYGTSTSQV